MAALNTGLAACRAPLLARMDGDDICHPRRLELQAAYLDAHADTGLVACNFRHFPRTTLKQGMLAYETWQNTLVSHDLIMRDLFVESPFVHPSIMARRRLIKAVGGYRDCGWAEDYDLWLRLADSGIRFARLPQTLFFWRDHPERATRTMSEYSADAFRACKLDYLVRVFFARSGVSSLPAQDWKVGPGSACWQAQASRYQAGWMWIRARSAAACMALRFYLQISSGQHGRILVAIGVRGAREQFRNSCSRLSLKKVSILSALPDTI